MRWLALVLVPAVAHAAIKPRCPSAALLAGVRPLAIHSVSRVDTPDGLSPADLAAAYGIPVDRDPGATVAVIEAYGYPTLDADLASYRTAFGLPPCTTESGCLTIVDQRGGHALPGPPPATADQWMLETALDVDMVSAGCPKCRILVVEADSQDNADLARANDTAAALGAIAISNSWGGPENAAADAHYAHAGVATFAATGDQGQIATAGYPASAPGVIAVGGTLLSPTPFSARGWEEAVWDHGGSACSAIVPRPAGQPATTCAKRHVPDVVAVADGPHGIAAFHAGSWLQLTGTSAASPLVAAIYAITKRGSETYAHPELFFDIVEGSNGSSAAPGFDEATGLGSPNAAAAPGASLPLIELDPANGAREVGEFPITVTCTPTDGSTVERVLITLDNQLLATLTEPPYTRPDTHAAQGGHHLIASCATTSGMIVDAAANFDVCASASVCTPTTNTLARADCNAGGAAPLWVLLTLRWRRARGSRRAPGRRARGTA